MEYFRLGVLLASFQFIIAAGQAAGTNSVVDNSAKNQLEFYAATHPNDTTILAQNSFGAVFPSLTASLTVGPRGPVLLQDSFLIEKLQQGVRDKIVERNVHAKGAGAFGYFQVTHDISKYTKAAFLQPGKRTKVAARFSGATGEAGSADTRFDPRGFAVKFYTEEGIYDFTGNNLPVFMVREPMIAHDITKARRRNPQTHLPDLNAALDLISERPEMAMFLIFFTSDMANPKSYRCMKGYGINTYKMVNAKGKAVYVKLHWTPNQKQEYFTLEEAIKMYTQPDILIEDLYDSIAKKNFPSWNFSIQVMTYEQAAKHPQNPFDATKFWKTEEYPLIPVGKMVLNKNPVNYFVQVEQIAFSPSNMVPGIEASPDRLLHARMFAYPDSQLYRLGTNYAQIPVNRCPFVTHTYLRDGSMNVGDNGDNSPNYYPNTFHGYNGNTKPYYRQHVDRISGDVDRVDLGDDDNFSLPKYQWEKHIGPEERQRMIKNAVALLSLASKRVQQKVITNILLPINEDLANTIKAALKL
ncbi:catalase-like [Bradysia coprophila]|uniref:catalase-like n=1 Tax=Bradysia coprophila TaxID=38358 RepID=UPI00187DD79B|nr:catalase-like [Bradysia coprophila]